VSDQAKWDRQTLAQWVAADIPGGSYVNLGIGMPTLVADYVDAQREIIFHSENGILGVGPKPEPGDEDWDLVNAGKECVTLVPGSAILSHSDSFALIRGRHLDLVVMGAMQVSGSGDLANWSSGADGIPAVGGAMDLAVGARQVWVMMQLLAPDGSSKLVSECTYPLTARGVVKRVYSDIGIFEFEPDGPVVTDMPEGVTHEGLEALTGLSLRRSSAGALRGN
jgi:3-oxoadipate CoA-transferase beta subunit